MNIAKCKLDKRGRITLPLTFLKANDINPKDHTAVIQVVANNTNTIRILFIKKGEEELALKHQNRKGTELKENVLI